MEDGCVDERSSWIFIYNMTDECMFNLIVIRQDKTRIIPDCLTNNKALYTSIVYTYNVYIVINVIYMTTGLPVVKIMILCEEEDLPRA